MKVSNNDREGYCPNGRSAGWKRQVFCLAWLFAALLTPQVSADLQVGRWTGSYHVYQGERLRARYDITQASDTTSSGWQITMILVDLEPRDTFTYELKNVAVAGDELSFTLVQQRGTKRCKLSQQEGGEYAGKCQAEIDTDGKWLSSIVILPPEE